MAFLTSSIFFLNGKAEDQSKIDFIGCKEVNGWNFYFTGVEK